MFHVEKCRMGKTITKYYPVGTGKKIKDINVEPNNKKMKYLKLMLLLFFLQSFLFAQQMDIPFFETNIEKYTPENINRITVYMDKSLLSITEYDKSGKIIFSQNRLYGYTKNIFYVYVQGYIYDDKGLLVKEYSLSSNVGASFLYYDYDSLERKIKSTYYNFQYENHKDLINTNAYKFIDEIKTMADLTSHHNIKEMEEKKKYISTTENIYDNQGNLSQEINFNEEGRRIYKVNKYDSNNNLIHYLTWSNDTNDTLEIYYKYRIPFQRRLLYDDTLDYPPSHPYLPKRLEKKHRCSLPNNASKEQPLLQSIWIINDPTENKKEITRITHYAYDFGKLIDERKYQDGEFQDYIQYKYNCSGQVIQRDWCRNNINNSPTRILYKYNKKCFVCQIKKIEEKDKVKVKLSYKLEFYDKREK